MKKTTTMRHLLTIIIVSLIGIASITTGIWKELDFPLAFASDTVTKSDKKLSPDIDFAYQEDPEDDDMSMIDTIMFAKGHSFGYSGDVSMWGGWYVDTICVGDDEMLHYDSVGPSTLKLSLITRELIVDLGDKNVVDKIRKFMNPLKGFQRFRKEYEQCLDSLTDEENHVMKCWGEFTFTVDYPKSNMANATKINHFIGELTGISELEKSKVSSLSAFYAGFTQTKNYRPVYTGNTNDIECLSDFLAHKTFENWIRGGEYGTGSNASTLSIKAHIVNKRFVTFGKYEYDRIGFGHGMFTETFHTFNLKTGKKLTNKDMFKSRSFKEVKMRLFEVMAKDPNFLSWHSDEVSPGDIESIIEAWQSPSPVLKGTEWEEPERDFKFELPEGALTESGVVFSFQPYEIDCWAAGAFHFIVPYKKLMPYLTPEAKKLIKPENKK